MVNEEGFTMNNIGLILEGGGMRGVYTAGVLDAFIDEGVEIPYVIGVSSGATIGSSYLTKQKGRSKKIYIKWSQDKRFIGFKNMIKERSYFGMNFLFEVLPEELEPFDYEKFSQDESVFISCVSNCDTGEAEYLKHEEYCPKYYMSKVIRACNSLPIISQPVKLNNYRYLDGVLTDPLPLKKSIEDGNTHHIVVLTKKEGVEKKVSWTDKFLKNITKAKYPILGRRIEKTMDDYIECLEIIDELEKKGEVFVFRPGSYRLDNRYDRNPKALEDVYEDGYNDAMQQMKQMKQWMSQSVSQKINNSKQ